MRHKIAVVDWVDAFIDTDDFTRKQAKKAKGVRRYTVGWLVEENAEGVVMATDYYKKKSDGFNSMMFVPWGWITEFTVLEDE